MKVNLVQLSVQRTQARKQWLLWVVLASCGQAEGLQPEALERMIWMICPCH